MPIRLRLALLLCLLPLAAQAQETRATYDLRLLGIKLGEMRIAGRVGGGSYAAASSYRSTGAVGALARARFSAEVSGTAREGRLSPRRYAEDIDTGRRQSSARLAYAGGTPRVTGGTLAAEEDRLDPTTQRGTVDPLTALFAALRTQPRAGLCTLRMVIFDGARRSGFAMTGKAMDPAGRVTCSGQYRRIAGFSASAMRRQTVFPFTVTYAPAGELMQAVAMEMRSSYGKVTLTRR
ncbi:DUF3108 domain-containing protein [Roseovarius sp. SCSIO 43702]|uniref:DUF3108 domain-containing protein n=1 Tax=Roseovarius sp. SCSIO 43702 TaxID=2823043 RepID=UPI001C730B5A|nr:DUF3108 domain-containing protein [Roseovarius sp. SCSIO 43702]QYX57828.1 DUF3108 domain-containing protein [Roseovarius sp. SCSIO 43702]